MEDTIWLYLLRTFLTASTTTPGWGVATNSHCFEYGMGTSAPVTRITGASSMWKAGPSLKEEQSVWGGVVWCRGCKEYSEVGPSKAICWSEQWTLIIETRQQQGAVVMSMPGRHRSGLQTAQQTVELQAKVSRRFHNHGQSPSIPFTIKTLCHPCT